MCNILFIRSNQFTAFIEMDCNPSDLTSSAHAINTVYSFCITFLELVIL